MKTTQIQIEHTANPAAAVHLEKAFEAIEGVRAVAVRLEKDRVTVEHDDLDPEKLRRAIVSTGLRAELIPADAEVNSPSVPDMSQAHKA